MPGKYEGTARTHLSQHFCPYTKSSSLPHVKRVVTVPTEGPHCLKIGTVPACRLKVWRAGLRQRQTVPEDMS